MRFDPSRLRRGEWIAGASGLLLLAFMLALKWYGLSDLLAPTARRLGLATSVNGWHGLTHIRWLVLVTALAALALAYLQGARPAPALPVAMSVIVTTLGLLAVLALLYRVVINPPGADDVLTQKAGAYLGLAAAVALAYGGFLSMRQEGISSKDEPAEIETVDVAPEPRSSGPS
jgi:hypothetical protein